MNKKRWAALLFLAAIALSGCAPQYPGDPDPSKLGDRKPAAGANGAAPAAERKEGR